MDVLHKLLAWFDHNRNVAIGVALAVGATAWLGACQPQTMSVRNPPAMVNAIGLEREVVTIEADYTAQIKQVALARGDLAAQLEARQKIIGALGSVATMATTGTVDVTSLIGTALTLLMGGGVVGLALDNRRKDGVITTLKVADAPDPAPTPPVA